MKKLNIWLIKEGESLPVDKDIRLMRVGSLAKYLSEHGHKITWWTSSFMHGKKQYYCNNYKEVLVNANERVILLHSEIAYKKNVSFSRVIYHKKLAAAFKKYCKGKRVPDLIFCAWPTSQFAEEAVYYGKENKVPVIIDIRDFWPDFFCCIFPVKLQWIAKIVLKPLQHSASRTLKQATGITGMIPYATEWGCRLAGRTVGERDATIYIGNEKVRISDAEREESLAWWRERGVSEETWNICYFGTLSTSVDLGTVITAVRILSQKYRDIRLVIGGEGDCKEKLAGLSRGSEHIIFAGWLNERQMNSLMEISRCGVYSYKNSVFFANTFSNKGIQYLSGGLPILSSLDGFARKLLRENKCGLTYTEGNVQDCAKQIEAFYSHPEKCRQMAENACKLFEKDFEAEVVNQQFENYFYRILGGMNNG